jgi:hypothetical protein
MCFPSRAVIRPNLSHPPYFAKQSLLYGWTHYPPSAMLPVGAFAMRPKYRCQRPDSLISATEIASWIYCPESWRLEHGLGLKSSNQRDRAAGTSHHARKAVAERVAGSSIALGRLLAFLAAVVLLLVIWWWF